MSQRKPRILGAVAAFAMVCVAVTTGCNKGKGSGKKVVETRDVGAFDKVRLSGAAKLSIRVDPAAADGKIVISGDDDLVPGMRSEVVDGELSLKLDAKKATNLPLEVSAVVSELRAVEVSGAAAIEATNLRGDAFKLTVSGAATVDANGEVGALELALSGASSVNMAELKAAHAKVRVSGAGKAAIHATQALDVKVSGAGSVRYAGNPPKVDQVVTGVGSVKPL